MAHVLIVTLLAGSLPASVFSLTTSASSGDESGGASPATVPSVVEASLSVANSGSSGDESVATPSVSVSTVSTDSTVPRTSGSLGDDVIFTPPTGSSLGDGTSSASHTSASTGDGSSISPKSSGSLGDEGNTSSVTSSSLGDGGTAPRTSGSLGDSGVVNLPKTSGSTGDDGGKSVTTSGSTGDGGGLLPPRAGSTGDNTSTVPATSGSTGDNGTVLHTSASTGDEGNISTKTSGSTGDEGSTLPTSGSTGDGGTVPHTSGSTGDEGKGVPKTSGSTGDEGGTIKTSGSTGDEGGKLVVSGSTGDEGGKLPTTGSTGDEGGTSIKTSASTGDEGASSIKTAASTGDEGGTKLKTVASIGDEGGSIVKTSGGSTGDEGGKTLATAGSTGDEGGTTPKTTGGSTGDDGTVKTPAVSGGSTGDGGGGGGVVTPPACPIATIASPLSVSVVSSQVFSYTFASVTSPASANPVTFTLGVALPTGLSFNSATGVISGTPTQTGTFNIPVTLSSVCGSSTATLVLAVTPLSVAVCAIHSVSSSLSVTAPINQVFSHTFTATSTQATTTTPTFTMSGSLPTGLTFSTSTATITGTPTQSGIFSVFVTVANPCGNSTATFTLTVSTASAGGGGGTTTPPATGGGGGGSTVNPPSGSGGGGGGGGGSVFVLVSNPSVCPSGRGSVTVKWYTNYETSSQVVYGTSTVPVLGGAPLFGYQYGTEKTSVGTTTHSVSISGLVSGTQYFFRPVSGLFQTGYTGTIGSEISIVVGASTQCGNIVPTPVPGNLNASCPYITDFMRRDFNNNTEQVYRLQNFLRVVQGLDVSATGVFDAKTEAAVVSFQNRYAIEVLKPWGDSVKATGYVYIMTKQKINQIICGMSTLNSADQKVIEAYKAVQPRDGNDKSTETVGIEVAPIDEKEPPVIIIGQLKNSVTTSSPDTSIDAASNLATVSAAQGTTTPDIPCPFILCDNALVQTVGGAIEETLGWPNFLIRAVEYYVKDRI